ncbi:MAG: 2-phosphosulfolactate phosphatase [Chitinophagaceae bacterium]|nr:MAG: 2-phosphosulfolactate [Chitinophagaceae bacterium]TXT32404.1 MAG: 2-phosphosulfolactate phosphatase [Chitinophagaceae bacterium]
MSNKPVLHTILSPKLLDLYTITNSIVVVIDVFRATSTIATALYNGATKIIPVDAVDKCIEIGKKTGGITAGERDGKIIPGLDYGNSPAEYPRSFIEGKTLVLTTTNGTKLLHMALQNGASEIITGSFPNLSAVCDHLVAQKKNVILGCSAWKDRFNLEDCLFAGAVIEKIKAHFTIHCDSSLMAENMYALHKHELKSFIRNTTHWHRLSQYGLEKDLEYCVSADLANILPVFINGDLVVQ